MSNNFEGIDKDKLKNASSIISDSISGSGDKINALLNDENKLNELAAKMKPSDMDTIKKLLDNPEMLKMVLSSDKAKENFKKFLG